MSSSDKLAPPDALDNYHLWDLYEAYHQRKDPRARHVCESRCGEEVDKAQASRVFLELMRQLHELLRSLC
jgi:hypothetical protein